MSTVYEWLMAGSDRGDVVDRHVFACVLAAGRCCPRGSLPAFLGLEPAAVRDVLEAYFPRALWLFGELIDGEGAGAGAVEEVDLRGLLLANCSAAGREGEWLATIVARRCGDNSHLWQALGLHSRGDLSALMARHFRPLAERNDRNMKWKKFFYRALCEAEGMSICKSPNCMACVDFAACFGDEEGSAPLHALAASV